MTTIRHLSLICGLLFASLTLPIHAEQAIQSQNYAIHYNAFNTMIVSPEVAQTYGFTRARNRALLNISIIDNTTKEPLPAMVTGTRTNIVGQLIKLEFIQVKEKNAIYYIAPLRFTEGEMWRFDLQIQPDLKSDAIPLKFSQSFYLEQ
ncbi:DUF4426 domain-containing protein [Oceanospirillaceae bacterium]|jgi:hypothetical protein|nr:DUF4426 domain-containing protein [Oceanospirillaceae bacterium]MDA9044222.1 DUF4426 domain-containing protein [bacterium]MBT4998819.1 DUF4426 domain-containing protein [Oceanospirillaceae bacterium]MBT5628831.1 DUF4426 domain-containing protein [Oceanospirillaceae bacterium]MBT6100761.1 DUF4426 domain-containing protein [Oceanospirillaceae bacterium]